MRATPYWTGWDPEKAGFLQDDGKFICGYPIEPGRRCQRVVGEDWKPCWQHNEECGEGEQ